MRRTMSQLRRPKRHHYCNVRINIDQLNQCAKTADDRSPKDLLSRFWSKTEPTEPELRDIPCPSPLEIADVDEDEVKIMTGLSKLVRNASNVNDIRESLRAKGIRLRYEPTLSRLTFALMLASFRRNKNLAIADVHEFLGDPELNATGSKNFLLLLYDMTHFVMTEEHVFGRVRCLRDYLKLGIIPVQEVEAILRYIPMTRIADDRLLRNDPKLLQAVLTSVYKGISKCPVLQLKDLDQKTLRHCFFEIHRAKSSWGILSFARDILTIVDPAGLRLDIVTWALTERMAEDFTCREALQDAEKLQSHIDYVHSIRPALPKGRFVHFITSIAENIFLEAQFEKNRKNLLRALSNILKRIDPELFEMPRMIWTNIDLPNPCRNSTFECHRSHQLFIRLWVCVAIARGSENKTMTQTHRDRRIFKSLLAALDRTTDGAQSLQILTRLHLLSEQFGVVDDEVVSQLIEQATRFEISKARRKMGAWMKTCRFMAQASALPEDEVDVPSDHPKTMTRQIFDTQQRRLEEMEKEVIYDPSHGVTLFRELDGPYSLEDMLQNWAIYTRTKQSSRTAFMNLAKVTDITNSKAVEKMLLLALAGPIPRSVLFNLLYHHQPLQIAISQATSKPQPCTSQHHPEAYLNTLHTLAVTFACAPYLTPSESWRLVHRVYKIITRHDGPIRPVMGRALVQAGIHRSLEQGQRVPLPRWGLASRTIGRLEGSEREERLNRMIIRKAAENEKTA